MSFNARETVAIVGGGHAFGKAHGACSTSLVVTAKVKIHLRRALKDRGQRTQPSGTTSSFRTFSTLNGIDHTGPGGNIQWRPTNSSAPAIMMLTSDLALAEDPEYEPISREYANDINILNNDFAKAWYKLCDRRHGSSNPLHWRSHS